MHRAMRAARGESPSDLVVNDACLFNPFTCAWEDCSFAVCDGVVVGIGDGYDGGRVIAAEGARVVPGLIDAHVHVESSLLTPTEYGRLVLGHGTTSVIADPHEIANVAGTEGLTYMLREASRTPLDILYMLPSCVPATPLDTGGATLSAADLRPFLAEEGVIGLAEVMNVPGVLTLDADVWEKLALSDIIDGHAPLLGGPDLNAYILAGIQSDHECTGLAEAREKLRRGLVIMIREGSTERNLGELLPLVNACTAARCTFATDDRHADMLMREGHIDDCIKKAVTGGLSLELALRMATLSAAERFGLRDRGAIAPGRLADFCILEPCDEFRIQRTFKRGKEVVDAGPARPSLISRPFSTLPLSPADLGIEGSGTARVIGLVEGQILTEELRIDLDGRDLPDTGADILKAVVIDRYRAAGSGVGLVHGFGITGGAIACSVSHDSHNIVAAGSDDGAICRAVAEVVRHNGGMAAVSDGKTTVLPLECGGLMSALPYEEVVGRLDALARHAGEMGAIDNPFMYLSFLALTVIPHLRLTERGLFDVGAFADVPLFTGE
jgi:adenine deaminase